MMNSTEKAAKIKLLALDVDGVLTDGTLNIGAEGEIFKGFNARDGLGLSCLLKSGVRVAIITGRQSAIIHRRADDLNDLPALTYAGLACAPFDAAPEVLNVSSFISAKAGGRGAVREAAELILKAQGKWNEIVDAYMQKGRGDAQ